MISTSNVVSKAVQRANTLKLFVVPTEYNAMVSGGGDRGGCNSLGRA